MMETGSLFPVGDESKQIGAVGQSFSQNVRMIGHEAVRKNRKMMSGRRSQ